MDPLFVESMRYIELTSYLRLGEISNCISNHNKDCCLFPLWPTSGKRERFTGVETNAAYTLREGDGALQRVAGR